MLKTTKTVLTVDNPKFKSIKEKLASGETTIDTVKQYFELSDDIINQLKS